MCGRYYFNNETFMYVESLVQENDYEYDDLEQDLTPGQYIPVILKKDEQLCLSSLKWGYTMNHSSSLIINARSETIMDKKMFAEDVKNNRCVIPAKGFYEWDSHKHKFAFESPQNKCLFMVGIYHEKEVVIITTSANELMLPIHSRMPLMIREEDIQRWIFDDHYIEMILASEGEDLNIVSGHMQQSLFE